MRLSDGNLLFEFCLYLSYDISTQFSQFISFTNTMSLLYIFSLSILKSFELFTTSSDITISWCYFSFCLNKCSWAYLRPILFFIPLAMKGEKVSSLELKGLEQSDRVFSEMECFLPSPMSFLLVFQGYFMCIFIFQFYKTLLSPIEQYYIYLKHIQNKHTQLNNLIPKKEKSVLQILKLAIIRESKLFNCIHIILWLKNATKQLLFFSMHDHNKEPNLQQSLRCMDRRKQRQILRKLSLQRDL